MMYLTNTNVLISSTEYQVSNNSSWLISEKIQWNRPSETSFITSAINFFAPEGFLPEVLPLVRENGLGIRISKNNQASTISQNYTLTHKVVLPLSTISQISIGISANMNIDNKVTTLITGLTFGGKLTF